MIQKPKPNINDAFAPAPASLKLSPISPDHSLIKHFRAVEDPRIERTKRHLLIDIIIITLLAVICGANGWVGVATFGKAKYGWLKTFLELPNGIPSHDTFGKVFARLDPEQLQQCFLAWVRSVSQLVPGEVIPIDGKTLRRSYDRGDHKGAIHMVSAWASQNRLVLGQRKVDEKSNEITAIPELLKVLSIEGCIITIDALALACRRLRALRRRLPNKLSPRAATMSWPLKAIKGICVQMSNSCLPMLRRRDLRTLPMTIMKKWMRGMAALKLDAIGVWDVLRVYSMARSGQD